MPYLHLLILFSIPLLIFFSEASDSLCEDFTRSFNDTVSQIKSLLPLSAYTSLDVPFCSSTWSVFEPITLDSLKEVVACLKPTSCPQDVIPTHFLKQVFHVIGSDLLSIINKCIFTRTVPDNLKHASVLPHQKKKKKFILRY